MVLFRVITRRTCTCLVWKCRAWTHLGHCNIKRSRVKLSLRQVDCGKEHSQQGTLNEAITCRLDWQFLELIWPHYVFCSRVFWHHFVYLHWVFLFLVYSRFWWPFFTERFSSLQFSYFLCSFHNLPNFSVWICVVFILVLPSADCDHHSCPPD